MVEPSGEVEAGGGTWSSDPAWQLRKYLLLLAILVATVTYVAGMDPPGGVWLETKDGHRTGNPILPDTRPWRYRLFYYFNAASFAASLVVTMLLLFLKHDDERGEARLPAVRVVMVLDVLCLMVAYVAGSSRGPLTTVFASALCAVIFPIFAVLTCMTMWEREEQPSSKDDGGRKVGRSDKVRVKERRKVLMLLAVFVTTITYTAGLNPPGGLWEEGHAIGSHRAGDPILLERHPKRFLAFFICNTAAFAASLVVITLLLSRRLWNPDYGKPRIVGLYAGIMVALLGLMGAYAAASGRETGTTVYIVCLVVLVLLYIISIFAVVEMRTQEEGSSGGDNQAEGKNNVVVPVLDDSEADDAVEKARSLILLLATLAATVTYQAGLNPPGGVWRDNGDGHAGGSLILLATHARRYKVFFYCNSAAFVTSIVVVIMVQSPHRLVSPRALQAAVLQDLFGLMGAYASGSFRDVLTSIYVFALAIVISVVVAIQFMVDALNRSRQEQSSSVGENDTAAANVVVEQKSGMDIVKAKQTERQKEKKRKLLLLLAILAVSITYQAGLTPPGKFWLEHGEAARHVGDPVLADNYPRRYKAFFYCNATSFMVSVAVIMALVGRRLPDAADRKYWWRMYAAMGAGLIGLMGAYAAGTTRRVKTSVYVFALVGAVFLFAVLHIGSLHQKLGGWISGFSIVRKARSKLQRCIPKSASTIGHTTGDEDGKQGDRYRKHYKMSKYLLLLGILAASVTYQAGLDPPGSVWPSDGDGHAAGDPVLHDGSRRRYHAFFYSNSMCFITSIVVIVLLLQDTLLSSGWCRWPRMRAVHTAVVLDLLGLLVAYATGGSRDWGTSGFVLAMAATVLGYVGIYMALSYGIRETQDGTIPVHDGTGNGRSNNQVMASPKADEEQGNVHGA
jgi:ABC-type multidrug transport system fused ATPase/permease subunit